MLFAGRPERPVSALGTADTCVIAVTVCKYFMRSASTLGATVVCLDGCRKAQQRFRERQRARLAESEERLRHLSGALAQLQACCSVSVTACHTPRVISDPLSASSWPPHMGSADLRQQTTDPDCLKPGQH